MPLAESCAPCACVACVCAVNPVKRAKHSFAELAQHNNFTLPLVFSFLDVSSLLHARGVCQSWNFNSRSSLAWMHQTLNINLEFLNIIPPSSIKHLRHLNVVRNLRRAHDDTQYLFPLLAQLPALQTLRAEVRPRALGVHTRRAIITLMWYSCIAVRDMSMCACV